MWLAFTTFKLVTLRWRQVKFYFLFYFLEEYHICFIKYSQSLFNFEALRCGAYVKVALKGGTWRWHQSIQFHIKKEKNKQTKYNAADQVENMQAVNFVLIKHNSIFFVFDHNR